MLVLVVLIEWSLTSNRYDALHLETPPFMIDLCNDDSFAEIGKAVVEAFES